MSQTTRLPQSKICNGVLLARLPETSMEIPIEYWLVKERDHNSDSGVFWSPSVCENNIITSCTGRKIQFRIPNKRKNKYKKYLTESFLKMCSGPSHVLCDAMWEKRGVDYEPYTMKFYDKPNDDVLYEHVFLMAVDVDNNPVDYVRDGEKAYIPYQID